MGVPSQPAFQRQPLLETSTTRTPGRYTPFSRPSRQIHRFQALLRNRASDPVRAVLGHLDRRPAPVVVIDLAAGFHVVDAVAERPGRAVANRPDDLVHAATARRDERLFALVEHAR